MFIIKLLKCDRHPRDWQIDYCAEHTEKKTVFKWNIKHITPHG
jgi:hypothetical protein